MTDVFTVEIVLLIKQIFVLNNNEEIYERVGSTIYSGKLAVKFYFCVLDKFGELTSTFF